MKTSHIETGRRYGYWKWAGPTPMHREKELGERDISAVEVPPLEQEISAPHGIPQPRTQVLRRGVPTASDYENQCGFCLGEMEGCYRPRHPLKRPSTDSLNYKNSPYVQSRESSSKGTRDIWGETELCGFRAIAIPLLSPTRM